MMRDVVKYGRLINFAHALVKIRRSVENDLARPGLSRKKVLATVVQLLEKTLIRIGNEEYARANHSFGLTTMRDQHARVEGDRVTFMFRGKSGKHHEIDLRDKRLARIIKACRDLPGVALFQYVDPQGRRHVVGSSDVNAYLRSASSVDVTAKEYRTWAGTVLAVDALLKCGPATSKTSAKRTIDRVVDSVAKRLGNTRATCRKGYIHPAVLGAYLNGGFDAAALKVSGPTIARLAGLTALEARAVAVLKRLQQHSHSHSL